MKKKIHTGKLYYYYTHETHFSTEKYSVEKSIDTQRTTWEGGTNSRATELHFAETRKEKRVAGGQSRRAIRALPSTSLCVSFSLYLSKHAAGILSYDTRARKALIKEDTRRKVHLYNAATQV